MQLYQCKISTPKFSRIPIASAEPSNYSVITSEHQLASVQNVMMMKQIIKQNNYIFPSDTETDFTQINVSGTFTQHHY